MKEERARSSLRLSALKKNFLDGEKAPRELDNYGDEAATPHYVAIHPPRHFYQRNPHYQKFLSYELQLVGLMSNCFFIELKGVKKWSIFLILRSLHRCGPALE